MNLCLKNIVFIVIFTGSLKNLAWKNPFFLTGFFRLASVGD